MSECLCIYLTKGRKRNKPEFFCFQGSETKETVLYFLQKREMDYFTLKPFLALLVKESTKWDGDMRNQIVGGRGGGRVLSS